MEQFFSTFTASHFVGLVGITAFVYVARHLGKRLGQKIVTLNANLERLNVTIAKTDLLWDTHATPEMWRDLERMTQPKKL